MIQVGPKCHHMGPRKRRAEGGLTRTEEEEEAIWICTQRME